MAKPLEGHFIQYYRRRLLNQWSHCAWECREKGVQQGSLIRSTDQSNNSSGDLYADFPAAFAIVQVCVHEDRALNIKVDHTTALIFGEGLISRPVTHYIAGAVPIRSWAAQLSSGRRHSMNLGSGHNGLLNRMNNGLTCIRLSRKKIRPAVEVFPVTEPRLASRI